MPSNRYRGNKSIANKINKIDSKVSAAEKSAKDPHLSNGVIVTENLANEAVSADLLAQRAVTEDKIARGAIGTEHLGIINIISADSDLQFKVGSTTSTLDSLGRLSVPAQPSFRGYCLNMANQTGTVVYNMISHNIGGHFNSSTGRFTAPVTGRYLMSFHAFRQDGASGNWVIQFNVNGAYYASRAYDDSDTSTGYGPNTTLVDVISLSASDYVTVNISSGTLHGNDNCFFSGHFLG